MSDEEPRDIEGHPMTRAEDPAGCEGRVMRARREGRARTMFYSALLAGLVALAVVRVGEVQNFNQQADRNRVNCNLVQDDRKDRANQLEQQSDPVLGNPAKHIKPADFDLPPYSSFKNFRKLIVANAVSDRKRAREVRNRIENCEQVFPKRSTVPIIG